MRERLFEERPRNARVRRPLVLLLLVAGSLLALPALAAASVDDTKPCMTYPPGTPIPAISLPPRAGGPTPLGLGFEVLDITDVDLLLGRFELRARVTFSWCDPRLAEEARAAGADVLHVTGSHVSDKLEETWNPNLGVTNQVGSSHLRKQEMTIRSNGRINASATFEAGLAVNLDLLRFPFDDQLLKIDIEPFGWDRNEVSIVIDRERTGIEQQFQLAEWKIGAVESRVVEVSRSGTDRLYSQLAMSIPIQRKSGFYVWKAILPLILIVALSWSVFWISENAAGRIRICATVMLTIVAYQFATAADLPKLPYMTLFTAFTTLSFVTVFIAVVIIVVSSHRQTQGDEDAVTRSDRRARWMMPLLYTVALTVLVSAYMSFG